MAIAIDATSQATSVTNTSLTWSHTCSGTNRILFVACGIPTANTITGVTYNGVAMALLNKLQVASGSGRFFYLYYLANPATGANNIVVTSSGSDVLRACAASYTGAAQTGIPDSQNTAYNGAVAASASLTGSTTSVADNSWLISIGMQVGGPTTAGASTTSRIQVPEGSFGIFDSNAAKTPAGSYSLAIVNGDSVAREMGMVIASFAPFVASSDSLDHYSFFM